MLKTITIQKITEKPGTGKTGKPYVKYGISDQDGTWYNTFQAPNAVEGGEYEIGYEKTQYGNDLKSIKPVSETENKVSNNNRNNSIVRQHSQEMALRYLVAQGKSFSLDDVQEMTEWFAQDVLETELPF